jgi:hypothetical protein
MIIRSFGHLSYRREKRNKYIVRKMLSFSATAYIDSAQQISSTPSDVLYKSSSASPANGERTVSLKFMIPTMP